MSGEVSVHLAVDLGASNGRVIAGVFRDGIVTLEEVHRFENVPIEDDGRLYSDFAMDPCGSVTNAIANEKSLGDVHCAHTTGYRTTVLQQANSGFA